MIVVIDDLSDQRDDILRALSARLLDKVVVHTSYDEAQVWARDHGDDAASWPWAVISDYQLEDTWGTGDKVLRHMARRAANLGTGAWNILVSRHDPGRIGPEAAAMDIHRVVYKVGDWTTRLAADLAELDRAPASDQLDAEGASNRNLLAPTTPRLRGRDRLFLFSSPAAIHHGIDPGGPDLVEDFRWVGHVPAAYADRRVPLLMYRDRWLPMDNMASPGKLVQFLLRWRTVARERRRAVWLAEVLSFNPAGAPHDLNKGGPPVKSLERFARAFRDRLDGSGLARTLFGAGAHTCAPTLWRDAEREWRVPARLTGKGSDRWHERHRAWYLNCPPEYAGEATDGPLARMQFVLDDHERASFLAWHEAWSGRFAPIFKGMPHVG